MANILPNAATSLVTLHLKSESI